MKNFHKFYFETRISPAENIEIIALIVDNYNIRLNFSLLRE